MSWRIVSYYTIDTPYQDLVAGFSKSLDQFNLNYTIYPKPSCGSWEKNTQVKAEVIKNAMIEFPNDTIVWLDIDAIVQKNPVFFDTLADFDISCYYLSTRYNPHELLSGTIAFANNVTTRNIIDDWIVMNKTNKEWDQKNLQGVIESEKYKNIRIVPLPKEYIKIHLHDRFQPGINDADIVITHFQASRKLKAIIK
jgi:hypothetical protein